MLNVTPSRSDSVTYPSSVCCLSDKPAAAQISGFQLPPLSLPTSPPPPKRLHKLLIQKVGKTCSSESFQTNSLLEWRKTYPPLDSTKFLSKASFTFWDGLGNRHVFQHTSGQYFQQRLLAPAAVAEIAPQASLVLREAPNRWWIGQRRLGGGERDRETLTSFQLLWGIWFALPPHGRVQECSLRKPKLWLRDKYLFKWYLRIKAKTRVTSL